ncbi:hypothetical protein [Nocardioides sp.]|uniref:hypothetical protein n=1 Tax=Nocardioides sp. TaxID=35761 RepID=UPI0026146413|nr:hypothetical protein [Nocardioides sp.]MDI6911487.1 hypothetical protein [Nocardioides sp.]
MTLDQIVGQAPRTIDRPPVTAKIVRVDDSGIWAVPIGGDPRTPVGPCQGPTQVAVDEQVVLTWTPQGPWVQPAVDTSGFETEAGALAKADAAREQAEAYADSQLGGHAADTTEVHGIPNTAELETQAGAQAKADAAIADHEDATARFHGNTGVRRVVDAGDIVDLPDLELLVRRTGDVVAVWTREPVAAAFSGALDLFTLPTEFRPDANATVSGVYNPATGAPVAGASLIVRHDGTVRLIAVSGARHVAGVTATVNAAWPAAYPGTGE